MNAPLSLTEVARMVTTDDCQVAHTMAEEAFDRLTRMASTVLECPISLISFVGKDRQWFKSSVGLSMSETPRSMSFCAHTMQGNTVMVVDDATKDARFADNPLVHGKPHIRLYAGAPLIPRNGTALGALAVIDRRPRKLSTAQTQLLLDLAGVAVNEIEWRWLHTLDPATGTITRQHFMELAEAQMARARDEKLAFSVLCLKFHEIAAFGGISHAVTDSARLIPLVTLARQSLRSRDVMARLDEAEFAVLLPYSNIAQAEAMSGRIRSAITTVVTQVSIGAAEWRSIDANIEGFIERAKRAYHFTGM